MSPESTPTAATAIAGLSASTSNLAKPLKKVLVIDDASEIRFIITETLSIFGLQALAAEDGVTGIKTAQEHLPDLILCDINMPNLDGYGTLKAMRDHEPTATIPFIFLSGASDRITIR